jgi:acyl dehydratase
MGFRYFEDFKAGETVELGEYTIGEADILEFARLYDPQVFHIDAERARETPYGGLIASGWHTASLGMRMLVDGLLGASASMGSPGVESLNWHKPVRPGDTLRARITTLESALSRSRPDRGRIRSKLEILNQNGELVLSWIGTIIIGTQPKGAQPKGTQPEGTQPKQQD